MNTIHKQLAFTIVELLVVIGIIAVLAITLLALLNPAEAQKRNRDTNRLRALNNLQAIVTQYLEDGNSFGTSCTTTSPCLSTDSGNVDASDCKGNSNWLGGTDADLCTYSQTVPVDPVNGNATCVVTATTTGSCSLTYKVVVSGRNFEINVRMESIANAKRVIGDGGDSTQWVEVFNGPNDLLSD